MTFFSSDEHNKIAVKTPLKNILSVVDNTIKKFGYSVIVLHPQDFVKTDQNGNVVNKTLEVNQIQNLSRLIDYILSKGIRIVSFSKLLSEMTHSNTNENLSRASFFQSKIITIAAPSQKNLLL
jgi:hypothetical protein